MTDDLTLEALCNFLDAVEAGIAAARQTIKNMKIEEPEPDLSKLSWEQKQGEKGPFEQTSEKANGNCDLWKALKAKLKEHQGFWQSQDFKFWFDMNHEDVVDRRKSA